MSTQTPNLKLDLREGADIFNPLSSNANFETLDTVITEIRKKGGVPTYTTTASANLLKLSENPVPNETLFKFVAAGAANTWSYQETVNNIVALDGKQKTVKAGEMYIAWVNATNAMVVIAWPDVVDAQTFNGKGPAEWASKAQLDAVNQTAANATTTAQAAATVANQAKESADANKKVHDVLWTNSTPDSGFSAQTVDINVASYSTIRITASIKIDPLDGSLPFTPFSFDIPVEDIAHWTNKIIRMGYFGLVGESATVWYVYRNLTIKTTGITFTTANRKQVASGNAPLANDSDLIPYQIIGIK